MAAIQEQLLASPALPAGLWVELSSLSWGKLVVVARVVACPCPSLVVTWTSEIAALRPEPQHLLLSPWLPLVGAAEGDQEP